MLRLLVLLLLLLNAGYYAWSHGLLRAYGWAPAEQREPQRLTQQIRPEAITVLPAEEARRRELAQAPARPGECLQAGPFDEAQTEAVRKALEAALPSGAWTLEVLVEPAQWVVYMGKFPNEAALEKKRAELLKLQFAPQPLKSAALEPGLSLGRFDSQAAAQAELASLQRRGVRTARVVQESPETRRSLLRLPAVDEALRPRLEELKPALGEQPLGACAR